VNGPDHCSILPSARAIHQGSQDYHPDPAFNSGELNPFEKRGIQKAAGAAILPNRTRIRWIYYGHLIKRNPLVLTGLHSQIHPDEIQQEIFCPISPSSSVLMKRARDTSVSFSRYPFDEIPQVKKRDPSGQRPDVRCKTLFISVTGPEGFSKRPCGKEGSDGCPSHF
jgi:hypothetical protein